MRKRGARRFFGADDGDGDDGRLDARAHVGDAGAEGPQAVGLMVRLAHGLFALGKDSNDLTALQQA